MAIFLLASCIEDYELDQFMAHLNYLFIMVEANGRFSVEAELIVNETGKQVGLAHSLFPHEYDFHDLFDV